MCVGLMEGTRELKPPCPPCAIPTSHPLDAIMEAMPRCWRGQGWWGGEPRGVGVPTCHPSLPPFTPHGASPTKCLGKQGRQGPWAPHTKCLRVVGGHGGCPWPREVGAPHQALKLAKWWEGGKGCPCHQGIMDGTMGAKGHHGARGHMDVAPCGP